MNKSKKSNKIWFNNRHDEQYLDVLSNCLDLEYLINTALPIKDRTFEKLIQIDFAGIAGATLLFGHTAKGKEIQTKFENVIKSIAYFTDRRIRLKIRILLMYLYSDFSYAQIEAELTPHRSTIDNKLFLPDDDIFTLSPKDFFSSQTYRYQRDALDKIQTYYNDYCRGGYDPFILRFTCLPLNFCMLNVNNTLFIDPYTYAQHTRRGPLSHNAPVVSISKAGSESTVDIIEDHFRYMWNHPTTLFCEDATEWILDKANDNKLRGLSEVKPPQNVTFEKKGHHTNESPAQ